MATVWPLSQVVTEQFIVSSLKILDLSQNIDHTVTEEIRLGLVPDRSSIYNAQARHNEHAVHGIVSSALLLCSGTPAPVFIRYD